MPGAGQRQPSDEALRESPAETQDPTEQAALWVARLQSADATDEDRAAFDAWLSQDVKNAEAYNEFCDVWAAMREAGLAGKGAERTAARRRSAGKTLLTLAAAALLAVGALHFGYLDRLRGDHYTVTGEVRQIVLADGSTATLNSDTSIRIDFTASERRVTLLRGEAFFDVTANPERPFVVAEGALNATALGTAYGLRQPAEEGAASVLVQEGRVEVRGPRDNLVLKAREAAALAPDGRLRRHNTDVAKALAWMEGQLVFSNRPLKEVLGELERYRSGTILLLGDPLAEHRVSGIFDLTDTDKALNLLEQSLPLQIDYLTDWLVVVRQE